MNLSKRIATIVLLITSSIIYAQTDFNTKDGFVAEGYDVVAYFSNTAVDGVGVFTHTYKGAKYRFSNAENLKLFKANPEMYVPQYGGYCAWAVADKGKKVGIDPESFEIRDGKLYLFYDSLFSNTLKKWKKNDPENLRLLADKKWGDIKNVDSKR